MSKRWLGLIAVLAVGSVLTGCNLVSDPGKLMVVQTQRTIDPLGLQSVETALEGMDSIQTYSLKAAMQVATGRFTREVDFYGSVQLPATVSMDETIGGSDYLVYQDGQFAYYKDENRWVPMQPLTNLKPWDSLLQLLQSSPPREVFQLPKQTVVSWNCNVYQFRDKARAGAGGLASTWPGDTVRTVPRDALYTVYVDASDGQLRQIQVQSTVGIPGLGTSSFTGTTLMFGYNVRVKLNVPDDLLGQIENP